MRRVAQFEKEKLALRFWGYLKQQEIDSSLEEDESLGTWTIWVADEDKIDFAIEKHKQFSINPDDPTFLSSIPKAQETVTDKPSPQKSRFQEFNLRERWKSTRYGPGTVTLSLIITCVGVFLLSGMGKNTQMVPGDLLARYSGTMHHAKDLLWPRGRRDGCCCCSAS